MEKNEKLNKKNNRKIKVCMIVQNSMVKGGISAVINGYRGSQLEKDFNIVYVESYKDGGKFIKFLKGINGYVHFIKVLIVDKPDLVHIHSSFGPSFYRKLPFIYIASWIKLPIINHIHGSEFDKFYINASQKKKKLVQKTWKKCDKLIALSDTWKEKFSIVVPINNIVVIENYSIIAEDVNRSRNNNQVLFLGAINKMKGCFDIPSVVEQVIEKIPSCKFVIGGDGDIEEVKKIAKNKNVDKYMDFPGWIRGDKKDKLLRQSNIFFLPSYTEGMPMSILDAMGYALPIISTNIGSIPKIVHDRENGFLYEPGDIKGFSSAIVELLKDEKRLVKFSKESMRIVKEGYSLEHHLYLLSDLYRMIIL